MAEEEIEQGGITIGQIFRTIFSQKWLALIVAAAITIIGTLGLYFIGKGSEDYTVTFVSKIAGSGDTTVEFVFPDGKEFRYDAMVSLENLEKVKASDDLFKNINVEKMYEEGDISIIRTITEVVENSKIYEMTYIISAKTKYFKTDVVARDFLSELAQFPNKYLEEMEIDYNRYLEASRSAIQYDVQLNYLTSQTSFLSEGYSKFISSYGGNFVVKDGKTLSYYQAQLQAFSDRGDIERLKNKALEEGYVMSDENGSPLAEAIAKYESERFAKEREKEIAENALKIALDSLFAASEGQSSSVILDTEVIMNYTNKIAQLDKELEEINKYIEGRHTDIAYDKEVDAVEAQVEAFTKEYAEIASIVYSTRTTVNYINTSIIEVEGGMGLVMSAVLSLVVGIIVASIVAYAVGWNKLRKAGASNNGGEQPQANSEADTVKEETDENKE